MANFLKQGGGFDWCSLNLLELHIMIFAHHESIDHHVRMMILNFIYQLYREELCGFMGPSPKTTAHLRGRKWPTAAAWQKWGTSEDLCWCKLTFSFPTSFSDTEELQGLFDLPFRLKWFQLLVLQVIFNGFNFQSCVHSRFFFTVELLINWDEKEGSQKVWRD